MIVTVKQYEEKTLKIFKETIKKTIEYIEENNNKDNIKEVQLNFDPEIKRLYLTVIYYMDNEFALEIYEYFNLTMFIKLVQIINKFRSVKNEKAPLLENIPIIVTMII